MPPKIPLPTDDELKPEHGEMLANLPPLNVFRMVAGAPARPVRAVAGSARPGPGPAAPGFAR